MWTYHRGNQQAREFVLQYQSPRALRIALRFGHPISTLFDALDTGYGYTIGELRQEDREHHAEIVLATIAAYAKHYKLWHAPDGTTLKHHLQAGEERNLPPA